MDLRTRNLRRAALAGDNIAGAALVAECLRLGLATRDTLKAAAYLGHPWCLAWWPRPVRAYTTPNVVTMFMVPEPTQWRWLTVLHTRGFDCWMPDPSQDLLLRVLKARSLGRATQQEIAVVALALRQRPWQLSDFGNAAVETLLRNWWHIDSRNYAEVAPRYATDAEVTLRYATGDVILSPSCNIHRTEYLFRVHDIMRYVLGEDELRRMYLKTILPEELHVD